jgi:hypothetical protein
MHFSPLHACLADFCVSVLNIRRRDLVRRCSLEALNVGNRSVQLYGINLCEKNLSIFFKQQNDGI